MVPRSRYLTSRWGKYWIRRTVTSPKVNAAQSQHLDEPCSRGWIDTGDTASTYDPLSSLGIFKALRTRIHASFAVMDYLKGDDRGLMKYETLVKADFSAYLHQRTEYYRQE